MKITIKFIPAIFLLFCGTSALCQENISYPQGSCFFTLDKTSLSPYGFKDWLNPNNVLLTTAFPVDLSFVEGSGRRDSTAIRVSGVFGSMTYMSETHSIPITPNGFTVAFWTKYSFSGASPDSTTDVLSLVANGAVLWKCGITRDGSAFVSRYTKTTSGTNKLWNVRFWEPANTNISKYVHNNGTDKWIFIMIVQERGQVRLQVGLPNGRFDCMYLDYGLDDQPVFTNNIASANRKIVLFPQDGQQLYLDNLVFWNMPLCRAEAFAYFNRHFGMALPDSRYPFNVSSQKDVVQSDDVARMQAVNRSPNGCLSGSTVPTAAAPVLLSDSGARFPDENITTSPITFFPNPATDRVTIDLGQAWPGQGNALAQLYDMAGALVTQRQFSLSQGQRIVIWDNLRQSRIATGIYVLRFTTGRVQYSAQIAIDCGCGGR